MRQRHSGRRHVGHAHPGLQHQGRRRADVPVKTGSHVSLLGGVARLVLLSVVVGALLYGALRFTGMIGSAADYSGSGTGSVEVVIKPGATGVQIGEVLEEAGVVKTAEAFYQESLSDDRSSMIQPGTFRLRQQMSSEAAMDALLDRTNRIETNIVIPEGSRVGQIVEAIVKASDLSEDEVTDALDNPDDIGLPAAADGNPEGYLFPATYSVEDGMSARDLLRQMVAQTIKVEQELDIADRAAELDLSSEEVLTVASILEYEARRDEDYAKVARVLYNRLEEDIPLQLDSTVSYVSKREGDVWTTEAERADPSEYNTYQHIGLPPGPIGSPGRKTIEAALNPADGNWLYFFADKQGVTHFNRTFEDHVAECRRAYGTSEDGACGG
ncbi:MAG TPA: endolytic transglycosylase MltG [Aeromicrobium sp.]|nr:endolytic transglycosylase MltG [Aeromicrobium sp.]HKY56596.1 endolytic transglycosylase MltG [Aeromicrobium sp.]